MSFDDTKNPNDLILSADHNDFVSYVKSVIESNGVIAGGLSINGDVSLDDNNITDVSDLRGDTITADGSGGFTIRNNSGTTVLTLGAGGGTGATFAGGVNIGSNLTVDTNTLYVDATSNRVGVLTASPTLPFEVAGASLFSGDVTIEHAGDNPLRVISTDPFSAIRVSDSTDDAYIGTQSSIAFFGLTNSLSDNNLNINSSGDVGIGTTSPDARLSTQVTGYTDSFSMYRTDGTSDKRKYAFILGPNELRLRGLNDAGTGVGDIMSWEHTTGNVGIGTDAPSSTLDVSGTTTVSGVTTLNSDVNLGGDESYLTFNSDTGIGNNIRARIKTIGSSSGSGYGGGLLFETRNGSNIWNSEALFIDLDGNVGIGTSSPGAQLDISSSSGGVLRLSRNDTGMIGDDVAGQIDFYSNDSNDANVNAQIYAYKDNGGSTKSPMALGFRTGDSGSLDERFTIASDGEMIFIPGGDGVLIDQNNNGTGIVIDSEATTAPAIYANMAAGTQIVSLGDADSSDGSNYFYRNLASGSTNGPVMTVFNTNAGDDQAALKIEQDGTGQSLDINHNNNSDAVTINTTATSESGFFLYNNAVFTGTDSNSLLHVEVENASSSGTAINIQQDGSGPAIAINSADTAFRFNGSEAVSAAVGGSQDKKIKIIISGTTYYIPCYTA